LGDDSKARACAITATGLSGLDGDELECNICWFRHDVMDSVLLKELSGGGTPKLGFDLIKDKVVYG
jgi:hypothetical protein